MNTFGAFGPNNKITGSSLDETLLSNLFKEGGYETKAIGKWHLANIRCHWQRCTRLCSVWTCHQAEQGGSQCDRDRNHYLCQMRLFPATNHWSLIYPSGLLKSLSSRNSTSSLRTERRLRIHTSCSANHVRSSPTLEGGLALRLLRP
jgi:hypothetical protein